MEIGIDDWTVQIPREVAKALKMENVGEGPYYTVGIFEGKDAKENALYLVDRMRPILGEKIWAWSGKDILLERKSRLGHAHPTLP